ncbi:MAG: addiction module protein [bacterium]|nr:addiction module protein [bacterium]
MNFRLHRSNNLAEQLLSLPPASRAFLAEKLVVSIDNYADPEIEAAWSEEITRRIQEYEEGQVHGISSKEVFREARKRLDEARSISS